MGRLTTLPSCYLVFDSVRFTGSDQNDVTEFFYCLVT